MNISISEQESSARTEHIFHCTLACNFLIQGIGKFSSACTRALCSFSLIPETSKYVVHIPQSFEWNLLDWKRNISIDFFFVSGKSFSIRKEHIFHCTLACNFQIQGTHCKFSCTSTRVLYSFSLIPEPSKYVSARQTEPWRKSFSLLVELRQKRLARFPEC